VTDDATPVAGTTVVAADEERHASNLELFLDLVFVFAVTQIATLITRQLSAGGVGKGLLVAWLVWWQWSQFTWAGSAIDLQRQARSRFMVLSIIPAALIMTATIPEAYARNAVWFAAAYMGVQVLVLAMQGAVAMQAEGTRVAFAKYAVAAFASPAVVLTGAFFHGNARIVIWIGAAALNLIGAFRAAGAGEWTINPVHFAERHALFIIISLGEVLVAAGANLNSHRLSPMEATALIVSVAVACVLWWTYFAFIPAVVEHRLRVASGGERGVLARDLFTFGHFPLVIGLILYAVVVKHLMLHPAGHLHATDRWLLFLSAAMFIGGLVGLQLRVVRRVAPERLLAIAAIGALCAGGRHARGVIVVGLVAVAFALMQAVTYRRFNRSPLAIATRRD
jgi:low temperature requirement protein LtrA